MTDARVADAMRASPRERFLPAVQRGQAGVDAPIPIGEGQTNSAPHMVAIMAEALDVRPGHRVLEVGGGSGWHAAVLWRLAQPGGSVVTVERHARLAEDARRNLAADGARVDVNVADGSEGVPDRAPFDRISVAAGAPRVPEPLVDQLAPGGIMVIPVGDRWEQDLLRVRKLHGARVETETLMPVRFVPLVGRHGFSE